MVKQKEIKCIVWDLDNTIWDGILLEGDDLVLKPGIKKVIQRLDQRGILHSIASKGSHDDAMAKLKKFGLDEFFLYPEINWSPKSQSIANIQKNLNIGMDTFMFIDDQPFERDEVKSEHPEIMCVEASEYSKLHFYPRLNPKFITIDSQRRRLMYQQDQKRKNDEKSFNNPRREFLASLNINLKITEANMDDLNRAEELTVRTNQLNATGKTYSYDELKTYMNSKYHQLILCEMEDKYGSYGKIGLSLIHNLDDCLYIKLLLMSCRVMSYGVGTVLLSFIMKEAKKKRKESEG